LALEASDMPSRSIGVFAILLEVAAAETHGATTLEPSRAEVVWVIGVKPTMLIHS
jgi:hypothetical protein